MIMPPESPPFTPSSMKRQAESDSIVISGISGRYPESLNIEEFWSQLINGKELSSIDDRRWPVGLHDLPKRTGKVPNAEKFDASFFNVPDAIANLMDPQVRIFHETTFEAIVDAGLDPASLRGSRTGVYIGMCYSDTDSAMKEDEQKVAEYLQLGASQVSTTFGFKGTAIAVDTACASSFTAFHQAFVAIRAGEVDTAIVGGWAIHCRPSLAVCFHQLGMISTDGRSKCMDAAADGYCRSEAIVSIVLQRRSAAKRSYAKILNARSNTDGFKVEGITFPSMTAQAQLMRETYDEIALNPNEVDFVEAHMTGTAAGDPVESAAIASVLCENRDEERLPLKVGCLKSNMGHSEGASGLCAITKSCLMFQKKQIPPNINLKEYNPNIEAIKSGKLLPVTEKQDFYGKTIALNCFGFGGCNVHAVIQADEENNTMKNITVSRNAMTRIPRIINICSRVRGGLSVIKDHIIRNDDNQINNQFLRLLHEVSHLTPESGFNFRSTFLVNEDKTVICQEDCFIRESRPLYLFFPGWNYSFNRQHISEEILMLPGIKETVDYFCQVLNESGLNIDNLFSLQTEDEKQRMRYDFLCFMSIQIALVNLLITDLGVKVEGVTGFASGEITAAFASGVLTLKEVTQLICFLSLKIPLDNETNGSLYRSLETAVDKILGADFCRRKPSLWFTSSVARGEINCNEILLLLQNCFSDTKNQFTCEVFDFIDKNCVALEISFAEKSMADVLVKGLGPDIVLGQLSKNLHDMKSFLFSLGKDLYLNGISFNSTALYAQVQFPVTSTSSLSHLVLWNHDKDWLVVRTPDYFDYVKCNQPFVFDLMEPKYQYLAGHTVDGRILLPATGYLWLVWDLFAHIQGFKGDGGKVFLSVAVEFINVHFHRATILPKSGPVTVNVLLLTSTGQFSVTEGGADCVTGIIKICKTNASTLRLEQIVLKKESVVRQETSTVISQQDDKVILTSNDIYKELRVRGYDYGSSFQGLVQAASDGSHGRVKWMGNWVSFTDSLLQLAIIGNSKRELYLPTFIEYLKCDIKTLLSEVDKSEDKIIEVNFDPVTNTGCCRGLFLKGLKASPVARRSIQKPVVESYDLTKYHEILIDFDKRHSQFVAEYHSICRLLLQQIHLKMTGKVAETNIDKEIISKFISSEEDKDLVSVLHQLTTSSEEITLSILKERLGQIKTGKDNPLFRTMLMSEKLVRHMIDIVSENVIGGSCRSLDVVEVMDFTQNYHQEDLQEDSPSLQILSQLTAGQPTLSLSYQKVLIGKTEEKMGDKPIKDEKEEPKMTPVVSHDHLSGSHLLIVNHSFHLLPNESEKTVVKIESLLEDASKSMKPGSFVLILTRDQCFEWERDLLRIQGTECVVPNVSRILKTTDSLGFMRIGFKQHVSGLTTILVRKPSENPLAVKVIDITMKSFSWLNELKEFMATMTSTPKEENEVNQKIWLRAVDSKFNGIIGMINSLRKEEGGDCIRCFFAPNGFKSRGLIIDENGNESEELIPKQVLSQDLVMNVLMENESIGSYRFTTKNNLEEECSATLTSSSSFYLDVATKGDLSSLKFYDNRKQIELEERDLNNDTYDVCYSSLNFKDVMIASGRIPLSAYPSDADESDAHKKYKKRSIDATETDADKTIPDDDSGKGDEDDMDLESPEFSCGKRVVPKGSLGMEFSGKHRATGTRVMGMVPVNGISSCVCLDKRDLFIWPVPDSWSLEEAATVPVVYFTVYYALFVRGKLNAGETVLIHAGSGGVGQAAIHVCLSLGCTVFTTVGTDKKRKFIREKFPVIPSDNILNSRDVKFEEDVMRLTNGYGVDLVLNSLSEDKLKASVRLLAPFGRFLEIGKYDIIQDHHLGLEQFDNNRSFHAVCVAHLIHDASIRKSPSAIEMVKGINRMIDEGIEKGQVQPITRHVFSRDKIEEAFRFMASGKHVGKVLIQMRNEEKDTQSSYSSSSVSNSEDESEVARLETNITSGPRDVVNTIRRTTFDPEKVYIVTGGLGGFGLELCQWMVTNGARKVIMTSRSGVKTPYQKLAIQRMKKEASIVLVTNHDVSRLDSCQDLLTEAVSLGSIGGIFHLAMVLSDSLLENQTEEKFAEVCSCKANGAVNLDTILREMDLNNDLDYFVCFSSIACGRGNLGQINYSFANSVLERVCESRMKEGFFALAIEWGAIGDVGVVAEAMGGNDIVIGGSVPQRIPSCLSVLDVLLQQKKYPVMSSIVLADIKKSLMDGKEDLLKVICHVLGVKDSNSLTNETTLGDLGMDSLMAVEIRQGLERDYDVDLSAAQVRQLTIKEIKELGTKKKQQSPRQDQQQEASCHETEVGNVVSSESVEDPSAQIRC